MLNLAIELHAKALGLAKSLKFDKYHEVQRTLVSLYGTILEQSDSLIQLARLRKLAGTDAILRSLLEAFVDLSALMKDEEYIVNLNAAFHEQWLKLLENGVGGDNDFLAGFHGNEEAIERLEGHRKSLADCRAAGRPPLSTFHRFEKAGMVREYRSIYNILCSESHNNIRALINRHMRAEGGKLELVVSTAADGSELEVTLDSLVGILLGSSIAMHGRFESGGPEAFGELDKRLAELRKDRDC